MHVSFNAKKLAIEHVIIMVVKVNNLTKCGTNATQVFLINLSSRVLMTLYPNLKSVYNNNFAWMHAHALMLLDAWLAQPAS
jgi:hypothetical protein